MKRLLLLIILLLVNFLSFSQEKKTDKVSLALNKNSKRYLELLKKAERAQQKLLFKKTSKFYMKALELGVNTDSIDWINNQIIANNKLHNFKSLLFLSLINENYETSFKYLRHIDTSILIHRNSKKISNYLFKKIVLNAMRHNSFLYGRTMVDSIQMYFPRDTGEFLPSIRKRFLSKEKLITTSIENYINLIPNYAKSPEQDLRDSLSVLDSRYRIKVAKRRSIIKPSSNPLVISIIGESDWYLPIIRGGASGSIIPTASKLWNFSKGLDLSLGHLGARYRYSLSFKSNQGSFYTYYHDDILNKYYRLEEFELSSYGVGFTFYYNPFFHYYKPSNLNFTVGTEYQKYYKLRYKSDDVEKNYVNSSNLNDQLNMQVGVVYSKRIYRTTGIQFYLRYAFAINQLFNLSSATPIENSDNSSYIISQDKSIWYFTKTSVSKLNSLNFGVIISVW